MREDQYVVIQAFMLDELHLKGNELIVYATIYGFTQDGEHWFYGTRGYLAEWCGAQRDTVDRCLKSLIDKGYIERREVHEYGKTIIQYRATKNVQVAAKSDTPPEKSGTTTLKNRHINKIRQANIQESIYMPEVEERRNPTIEEVRSYVRERGYHFDPQHFFDYYSASGWRMQSGKPVKSWKQCCVTWERNCEQKGTVRPSADLSCYD